MPDTRIGISGWTYAPWRGVFYPKKLTQQRELEYASRQFNSIEINGTFYSLQRPSSFQKWHDQTSADFVYSVKGPRFITHLKRLRDVEAPLANFYASGILLLAQKLGPILWQFPPNFRFESERFERFLDLLPSDTSEAAKMAEGHDAFMKGRSAPTTDKKRPLRYAVEIRHESFMSPDFVALLRRHNVALCFADAARKFPYAEDVTADFIYCRLHGDEQLYASGYSAVALDRWAGRLRAWRAGKQPDDPVLVSDAPPPIAAQRDVHIYFDNDVKVRAPFDAASLGRRLGVEPPAVPMGDFPGEGHNAAEPRESWPAIKRVEKKPASKPARTTTKFGRTAAESKAAGRKGTAKPKRAGSRRTAKTP